MPNNTDDQAHLAALTFLDLVDTINTCWEEVERQRAKAQRLEKKIKALQVKRMTMGLTQLEKRNLQELKEQRK